MSHTAPPDVSGLPAYIFVTQSPLVATWLEYSKRLQLMRYDAQRRAYLFYDPDNLSYTLINDYNAVDPTVNLRRFHKTYKNLLAEKMRLDGQMKTARKRGVSNVGGGEDE